MKPCIIDFETFYSKKDGISVSTQAVPNYVRAADAYIVAVSVGNEVHCGTIAEMGPMMEQVAADDTLTPVACNANFDRAFHEKYWPRFKNEWFCILDNSAFLQCSRNLAGAARAILGRQVDKTTRDEMDGVRYEDLDAARQEEIQIYCQNDVIVSADLLDRMAPMSSQEQKIAAHTRMINRRGVHINTELVASDKTKLAEMRFQAFKSIPWSNDGAPLSHPQLTKWCATQGLPVPASLDKTNQQCKDLMAQHPKLAEVLGYMRAFRRTNTMLEKIETLMQRVTPEGILPLDMLYCGAPHTRRWSSKGFNVQNLDKEPFQVGDSQVWTRNWLIPSPGKKFLILDLAQIEPRCLNWLVGNDAMMVALRAGFSYYESYAVAAKGWKGQAGTLKAEFGKERYTKLKNECLGCGYGMGATKYTTYANVPLEEAKSIVTGFRKANPKVVQFWSKLDKIIASAATDKEKSLSMVMPTGDKLTLFNVRAKAQTAEEKKQNRRSSGYECFTIKGDTNQNNKQDRLWGGLLTENVTQRMARDVLADAILNLEGAGFPVIFSAHDEVILEVDANAGENVKEEAIRIMTQAPAWAPDLPLGAEGDFAESYTK